MRKQTVRINETLYDLYIDPVDAFEITAVTKAIMNMRIVSQKLLIGLVGYNAPPESGSQEDGEVRSWAVSSDADLLIPSEIKTSLFSTLDYVISNRSWDIIVVQVGKPAEIRTAIPFFQLPSSHVRDYFTWVIPHKGDTQLLLHCLSRIVRQKNNSAPSSAIVGFDDNPLDKKFFQEYSDAPIKFFKLKNTRVGPYVIRQLAVEASSSECIVFQDSDDVPAANRLAVIREALLAPQIDAVGSHELRINYFESKVLAIRYPIDVTAALNASDSHSLLFPTMVIRRKAFMEVGGLSTNIRYALDTQFLLRAHFSCCIKNVDDFLYIRRVRPGSLTTSKSTALGTPIRERLASIWGKDFESIKANQTTLSESNLSVNRGVEFTDNSLIPAWN